jgi:hypothetical protein
MRTRRIAPALRAASDSCIPSRPKNRPSRSRSARAQSATNRRPTYFRPAIVSPWGMTLFASSPIAARRESVKGSIGFHLSRVGDEVKIDAIALRTG